MNDSFIRPPQRAEDAKAWFYLKHRRDIEVWAALREDAAVILHEWLLSLGPDVKALADEFHCEYEAVDLEDGPFPRFGLWRPAWDREGVRDLSIVIEWELTALLTPGPNCWPFVAVRSELSKTEKERWLQLTSALRDQRAKLGAERDRPWPLWRYEEPAANAASVVPEDLTEALLKSLRAVWDACAPVLDGLRTAG